MYDILRCESWKGWYKDTLIKSLKAFFGWCTVHVINEVQKHKLFELQGQLYEQKPSLGWNVKIKQSIYVVVVVVVVLVVVVEVEVVVVVVVYCCCFLENGPGLKMFFFSIENWGYSGDRYVSLPEGTTTEVWI